jgi:putative nucleotidyltransferase with HDIG domain
MNDRHRRSKEGGGTWRRSYGSGTDGVIGLDPAGVAVAALDAVREPVFVVDADHSVHRLNAAAAEWLGRPAEEILGRSCYGVVHGADQPVEQCPHAAARADGRPHEAVVDIAGSGPVTVRCRPLGGAGDRFVGSVHVVANGRREAARQTALLKRQLAEALRALGAAAQLRDPYAASHQRRVAELAQAIAGELGLPDPDQEGLRYACQVHDIAKIAVPTDILSKPGALGEAERAIVRMHAAEGARLIADIPFERPVGEIVLQHHERLDGSGYPRGLQGDEVLLEARILAVADVTEAMVSDRPHRRPLGWDAAFVELEDGAGTRYDQAVVAACRRAFDAGFTFGD